MGQEKVYRVLSIKMPIIDEDFKKILKKYKLNGTALLLILYLRVSGYNNSEIAEAISVSRNTVNRYVKAMRTMSGEEINAVLYRLVSTQVLR